MFLNYFLLNWNFYRHLDVSIFFHSLKASSLRDIAKVSMSHFKSCKNIHYLAVMRLGTTRLHTVNPPYL